MTLKTKVVHGIFWVTIIVILSKLSNFITKLILARLLIPADFGLIAIALFVVDGLDLFRDLGIGAGLIYKKDDSEYKIANTAFLILPIVAAFLVGIAYVSAPYIAFFFNNESAEPIIKVITLTLLLSSFGIVPSVLLEKEMEFKKKVIPEIIPSLVYAFTAIILAILNYGVWSLVYGRIALVIVSNVLLWSASSWRPTFKFDTEVARDLIKYGKHVMSANIVIFFVMNIDTAIIGRMLGTEALGYYAIALTIANLPTTLITFLIDRVMFPAYSKLQNDREALKNAYLRTIKYVSILSIPTTFGIFIIAPDFVILVLGEKWIPAISALQVLCFYGLIRSIGSTTGNILLSIGKPSIITKTSLVMLFLILIFIYPSILWLNITGAALVITLISFIIIIWRMWLVIKMLNLRAIDVIKQFSIPIFASATMVLFGYLLKFYINISIYSLIFSIFLMLLIYLGASYIYSRKRITAEIKEIMQIIR